MAKEAVRTISIKVNSVAPTEAIGKIKKEFKDLRKKIEEADDQYDGYFEDVARLGQLKGAIKNHNQNINRIAKGWDETKAKVDGYGNSFKNPLKEFLNFKNLTAVGLATTLVSAAAAFGAEMIQVSKEINKLRGDIQNLTDLSGEALEGATAKARALGQTFEADTQEIILAANAIQDEFGGSFEDALGLLEQGFLAGADANGEFLSQMREYPAQFAAAGASAENFVEIVTRSTKEGVFSDKGADVVKEFGLRIREQTTATKDALENAFGQKFTKELFDNINSGAISTTDALKMVSSRMDETQIPAKELQTVIADVYGGPGEDAGLKFIKSLESVGEGMEAQIDTSNDLTNQRIKQLEAEQELAAVQTQLSAEIQGLTTGTSVFVTQLKTGLLEIVIAIIRQFQNWITWGKELYENVGLVRFVVDQTAKNFRNFFNVLKATPQIANGVVESIKFIYRELQDFGANVVSNAKIAIQEAKNLVGRGDQSIIDAEKAAIQARNDGETIKDAFLKGFNSVKNNAPTDIPTVDNSTNGAPSQPTGGGRADFKPPVTSKTIDENAKNLERLKEQIAKFQDEQYLANLDANTKELEQIRKKYDEQIALAKKLNATDEVIALEELKNAEIEAAHQKHIDKIIADEEAALEKQLELLDEEIEAEEQRLEEQQEEKLQKEQEYQARKRELQEEVNFELMSNLERELLALDAHYDALIAEAEEYGLNLSQIKELQAQKEAKQLELQAKAQDKADADQLAKFKERVNERAQSFQALGSIFGSVADLMVNKEGEALEAQRIFALAEIAFNAASGVAGAIAAGAGVPFPGNLVAIATGVGAVTSGIAQARKLFAQQKQSGGFVEIHGKDDGKKYNAKRIGSPSTGMLPNHPVLLDSQVLASEAGQEYFVSNKSLQNPAIMDLVQTIDNIERQGVRQFQGGGAVNGSIGGGDSGLMQGLMATMQELNENIKRGLYVNIGFNEIEKIQSLSDDLNKMK